VRLVHWYAPVILVLRPGTTHPATDRCNKQLRFTTVLVCKQPAGIVDRVAIAKDGHRITVVHLRRHRLTEARTHMRIIRIVNSALTR
jgi:hypothetical protein